MAQNSVYELPIIDFSKEAMKPGTKTWDLTCEHVVKALEEYGCFMATFSEINNELYAELFNSMEKLFDLPKETKLSFTSEKSFSGYTTDAPQTHLLQSMQLPNALNFETIQNLALRMWPDQGDAALCETIHSYVMRLSNLEKIVRKMIFQNYGVEKRFENEFKSMNYTLRLMKYEAPMTDETTVAANHYDPNLITILQADGDGLQVQAKNGEWIGVTPSGSSLIVLIGESFHGWSNGRLRCALHRVKMSGFKSRYSVGLFSGNIGKMKTPRELVDEQHPLLFKPFDSDAIMLAFKQRVMDKAYTGDDDNLVPIVRTHFAV